MINEKKLYDELITYFAYYEWRRDFVPMSAAEYFESEKKAVDFYRNNPIFHARVNQIASNMMVIINDCIEK